MQKARGSKHARRTKEAHKVQRASQNQDRELQDRLQENQTYSAQDGNAQYKRKVGDSVGPASGHSEVNEVPEAEAPRRMQEARGSKQARTRTKEAREAQEAIPNHDGEHQQRHNEQQLYSVQGRLTTNQHKAAGFRTRASGHSGDSVRDEQVRKGAEEQVAGEAEEARRSNEAHGAAHARSVEETRQADEACRMKQTPEAECGRRMQEALQFQACLKAQQAQVAHNAEMKNTQEAAHLLRHVSEHSVLPEVRVQLPKHPREARRSQNARTQHERRKEGMANDGVDGQMQSTCNAAIPLGCSSKHDAKAQGHMDQATRARLVPESPATPGLPCAFPQRQSPPMEPCKVFIPYFVLFASLFLS
jgi:hypothetical protein